MEECSYCARCGSTAAVAAVSYVVGGGTRTEFLCDECKSRAPAGAGTSLGGAFFAVVGLQAQTSTAVSIDGRVLPANVGQNTLVNRGENINGGTHTVTTPVLVGAAQTGTTGGTGGAINTGGGLVRTGSMILRWTLAAAALMAIGVLLVVADRRRGRAREQ